MTPEDAKKLHPGDRLENRIGYLPVRGVVVRLTPTGFIAKWESRDEESGVLILWMIGTNVVVGGAIVSAMLYLNNQLINQFTLLLQHWKP